MSCLFIINESWRIFYLSNHIYAWLIHNLYFSSNGVITRYLLKNKLQCPIMKQCRMWFLPCSYILSKCNSNKTNLIIGNLGDAVPYFVRLKVPDLVTCACGFWENPCRLSSLLWIFRWELKITDRAKRTKKRQLSIYCKEVTRPAGGGEVHEFLMQSVVCLRGMNFCLLVERNASG